MKLSYSQIESYCNEMHLIANRLKETLSNIQNNSLELSKSDAWVGESASNYINKIKKLTINFDDIYKELENAILFLAKTSDGYKAIDQNVINEICMNLNISEVNLSTSDIFQD